ncbi:hypothetical protein L3X38_030526 [Prunus dulcis]|uniref:Uncharacterized protein n=1 Tax=Prunus dulcis TaxID=3755 RepID=A0AAD4VAI8_PRUDU|nr:hypothetical protein L3X38_030526 [Prunus dulcis]
MRLLGPIVELRRDMTRPEIIKWHLVTERKCNISKLNLSGLNLSNLEFQSACLKNVLFFGSLVKEVTFKDVDADFGNAKLVSSKFRNACLKRVSFSDSPTKC